MSLLEDVFLEDETTEAQDLERVIEGGEDEELGYESQEGGGDDEAEEDKRRVDPSNAKPVKVVKNPRFLLNPARLTGPRGIQVIPEHFKDFKFKGKGHEKEDLDLVLKKLEHWAYRLYPKFKFEDCLKKIETLGKKRPVMVHLHKIRSDQFTNEETVVQKDSSDDEEPPPQDEFDILLQQQIDLVRSTPGPNSAKKGFGTPQVGNHINMPKATSSPSINEEQKERMLRNKKLAEERRLARLNMAAKNNTLPETPMNTCNIDDSVVRKSTDNNSMDHSDDESNVQCNKTDNGTTKSNSIQDKPNVSKSIRYTDSESDSNDGVTIEKKKKTNVLDSSDDELSGKDNNDIEISKNFENEESTDFNEINSVNDKVSKTVTNTDDNFDKLMECEDSSEKEITTENDNNVEKNSEIIDNRANVDNQEAENNIDSSTNVAIQENIPNIDINEDIITASEQDNINNLAVTENQFNLNNEDARMVMEQDFDDEF